jgi:hypothetical protein
LYLLFITTSSNDCKVGQTGKQDTEGTRKEGERKMKTKKKQQNETGGRKKTRYQ